MTEVLTHQAQEPISPITDNVRHISTAPSIRAQEQHAWDEYDAMPHDPIGPAVSTETSFSTGFPTKRDMVLSEVQGTGGRRNRRATRDVTTIGEKLSSSKTAETTGEDTQLEFDLDLPPTVKPTEPLKDTQAETPFAMWEPVKVREEKPRDKTEAIPEDRWYRSLSEDSRKALANHVARRNGKDLPFPYDKNPGAKKVERTVEAASWLITTLSPEKGAAIEAFKERHAEKLADLAMIPESEAGDDMYVRSLDEEGKRAYDKIAYRYEKRARERAKEAGKEFVPQAPAHQEALRKVLRMAKWVGEGVVKASILTAQAEIQLAKTAKL